MKVLYIIYTAAAVVLIVFACNQGSTENIKESQKYFNLGLSNLENENYYGALKNLDKCVELDPENYDAYYKRAQAK